MLQEISVLEATHKVNQQEDIYFRLQERYTALNVLDAQKIGQLLL